jgi:GT2 family glycosyltransferase
MEAEPLAGMCASRIVMREGTTTDSALDSAGMLICFDGSSKQRGHFQPAGSFPLPEEVLLPSGCAALYRRSMLNEIGLFDEDYFLYCEDTDLGLRARWAGWRCRYVPEAIVFHHYSSTAGAVSVMKARLVERNRLWVALKNFPGPLLVLVPFVSVVRYFWQFSAARGTSGAAAEFIRSGNSWLRAAGILLRAHRETILHLPALLRKRARLRGTRKLGSLEFTRLMYRHHISAKDLARA